jgi:hypothetical protein
MWVYMCITIVCRQVADIIIAPICQELVYVLSLYNITNIKTLFNIELSTYFPS